MVTYSHQSFTGSGNGTTVEITPTVIPGYPPVMIATLTSGTFAIQGSHDNSNWVTLLSGATSAVAKDLIPGIRYWRTVATSVVGLTSAVGDVPGLGGMSVGARNPGTASTGSLNA